MTSTPEKNHCAICNKAKATLRCSGCSKDFCFSHVANHRQELCKQLDEVEATRDLFRQTLTEQTSQPQNHSLIRWIDQWECDSISKVQQTAEKTRQMLLQHTTKYFTDIEIQLNTLTDQLRQSRQEDDFFEMDLSRWKKELARLDEILTQLPNINVRQDSTTLVSNIILNTQSEKNSTPKSDRQKVDQYFKFDRRNHDDHSDTTDQSSKRPKIDDKSNNQVTSKTSPRAESDDDDENENVHDRRQAGPVTRSRAAPSKLRITFDDSDSDENAKYYSYAQRDISEYRNHYEHAKSNPRITDNYDFYTNKIRSHPDGDLIDNIHAKWFGDYKKLEHHDVYIEWLFPLQEKGLNWSAEPLQKHEIESIRKDNKAWKRILKSYELMLDLYGFQLVDKKTGEIRRSPGDSYKARFRNLNTSSHNYLRITRILKCLGEFDYEYLKFPFLEAILRESITEDTLTSCLRSCKDYWIETLRSRDERRAIRQYARDLVKYRNDGILPPRSHRASRPSSTSATIKQIQEMSLSRDDDDGSKN